ncbi:membrane metallo-endopeptidase-like 1 isoform X2 [Ornithodoros turicata]|uniref:membrane metallo-endopeptidase-like 1 isoform X2 n=1 Tax=Ornithodoros turicata TaxID=34597 RepID=UPI003138A386
MRRKPSFQKPLGSTLRERVKRISAAAQFIHTTRAPSVSSLDEIRDYAAKQDSIVQRPVLGAEGATQLEVTLTGTCFLLTGVFFTLSLITAYFFIAHEQVRRWLRQTKEYEPCPTDYCANLAQELSSAVETDDDLCGNFYHSMCDNICAKNLMRPQDGTWSVQGSVYTERLHKLMHFLDSTVAIDHPVSNTLSAMYISCKNGGGPETEAVTELLSVLRTLEISDWPLKSTRSVDASKVIAQATRHYNLPMVITLSTRDDIFDASKPCIYVENPRLLLRWSVQLHPEWYPLARDSYHTYIVQVTTYILGLFNRTSREDDIAEFASQIAEFEGTLAKQLAPGDEVAAFLIHFHRYTLTDLLQMNDMDQWMAAFALAYRWNETVNFAEKIPTFIDNVRYLQFLNGVMLKFPVKVVNYIGWRILEYFAWTLSKPAFSFRQEFQRKSVGATEPEDRSVHCMRHVITVMPFTASRLYRFSVAEPNTPALRQVSHMVTSINLALTVLLQEAPWIDKITTNIATSKVAQISMSFGAGRVPQEEDIDDRYTVQVPTYTRRLLDVVKQQAIAQMNKLVLPNAVLFRDVDHMGFQPLYRPYHNVLHLPVGLTEYPFFSPKHPASVNFAHTGFLIAEELMKAIVGPGRLYLNMTFTDDWWTEYTRNNYKPTMLCFRHIHKNLNLDERETNLLVRRNGAFHLAYKAFKVFLGQQAEMVQYSQLPRLDYTQSQLFFFFFVRNMCVSVRKGYLRASVQSGSGTALDDPANVNMLLSHFEQFRRSFNCPSLYSCTFWRLEDSDWFNLT